MLPDEVSTRVQLTSSVCTAFAIAMTLLRLYIRRRSAWVDDVFATISMIFLTAQMAVILHSRGSIGNLRRAYVVMSLFYATVWSARMSILFTIMRIGRGGPNSRFLPSVAVAFTFFWSLLTGQIFWTCEGERQKAGSTAAAAACLPTKEMAGLQLVADSLADLTLLLSSLHLFRVIQDSSLRHRLKFIFSSCMGTTLASIVHASFILRGKDGIGMLLAALVEGCVALTVSSLPVIANIFFRLNSAVFHHSFPRGASQTSHSASASILVPLAFAPSPDALSICGSDCDCELETPSPVKAKTGANDVVRTASDLERFSLADLPRLRTEGLTEPPAVHIQLHLISPC